MCVCVFEKRRRAPDSARVKSKMMYASTKDFFKSHLDGLSLEFQASDLDEVSEQVNCLLYLMIA